VPDELSGFLGSFDWDTSGESQPKGIQWVEEPVPLDVFVTDQRYLKNPPLSLEQYNAVRCAERVFFPATYAELGGSADREIRAYWSQLVPMVNFITLQWGKGGGKDHTCRIMSMRVAYLTLCLPSPQDYYGFAGQDEIQLLNVASSAPQANMAFFGPMRRAVMRKGCWLGQYANPLQGVVEYANGVSAISGHSDAETQEGLNILLGVADEVDAFKRQEELEAHRPKAARESTKSAEAILKMLQTSMITRFPLVGKNVRISYPRYKGSMIQQLTTEARKEQRRRGVETRHYVSGPLATWIVNPLRTKADFDAEYEDDPVLAKARYECDPAAAVNPFFSNEAAVEACVKETERDPLTVRYEPEMNKVIHPDGERATVRSWTTVYDFAASLAKPKSGAVYAMHADLAVNKDCAGIAMAHVRDWEEQEVVGKDGDGTDVVLSERRPFVAVDFVMRFEADMRTDPPREIQVRWARELCLELRRRGFNVRWFSFDGFQSVDSMQILESNGIESKRVSTDLKIEPYRGLRDMFNEARIELPLAFPPDRDPLLLRELYGLNKQANGKIDHPVGGCFTGETRVPLLDGREVQIRELADGQPVWVYASDENGCVAPALAVGRRTKQVRQVCDVVLDTGAVVRCTPEHLWRLRDGTYKEAQFLTRDDRLLPFSRRWDFNSGYEMVWSWGSREQQGRWTHVLVREYLDGRSLLPTEVSHHDNENKRDNAPGNLIRMDSTEHHAYHSRKRHAEDHEYHERVRQGQQKYWTTDDARERQRAVLQRGDAWDAASRKWAEIHQQRVEMLRQVRDAKSVGAAAKRVGLARNSAVGALKGCGFADWADFLARDGENHRIRFTELVELEEPAWVYDLEVDTHHNFALTAGVFVHNSKDMADALACAVQAAVQQGGMEDGGVSYPGGEDFVAEPAADLADALPIGFVSPIAAGAGGFGYEVMRDHISLDNWEDSLFGEPMFGDSD
jgi:hypothetical protein